MCVFTFFNLPYSSNYESVNKPLVCPFKKHLYNTTFSSLWNCLLLQTCTKEVGKVVQFNSSLFQCPKRWFSLLINTPIPFIQCWGITEHDTRGQGKKEKRGKSSSLIKIFHENFSRFPSVGHLLTGVKELIYFNLMGVSY